VDVLAADLIDASEVRRVVELIGKHGEIDLLIHAAGFATTALFAESNVDRQVQMVELHTVAAVRLSRAVVPEMIARGHGGVILVSSFGSFAGTPGNATYSATKAFLRVLAEALHTELSHSGVRVQALCPGFSYTEFHDSPEFAGFDRSFIPRAFWMSADEVATDSLRALERGQAVVVPGLKNRLLVAVSRNPLTVGVWRWAAERLRRRLQARHRISA